MFYTLLLSIVSQGQGALCPVVRWNDKLPEELWYRYNQQRDEIDMDPCDNGFRCDNENSASLTGLEIDTQEHFCVESQLVSSLKYSDERWTHDIECFSGTCDGTVWLGKAVGIAWGSSDECDSGLTCRASFCTFASQEGESCELEENCFNDQGCYNGVCVRYFSLGDGAKFDGALNHFVCKSGYASQVSRLWVRGPELDRSPTTPCTSSSDWKIKGEGDITQGPWFCGLNRDGLAYCGALQGEDEYTAFTDAFKAVMEINSSCHTKTAYNSRCSSIGGTKQVEELTITYYAYAYRHRLIDAPDCAISVILPNNESIDSEQVGNDSEEDPTGELGTVGIIVIVVVVFMIVGTGIVSYIIVRKCHSRMSHEANHDDDPNRLRPSSVVWMPDIEAQRERFSMEDLEPEQSQKIGIPVGNPTDVNTLHPISNPEESYVVAEPLAEEVINLDDTYEFTSRSVRNFADADHN